MKSKKNLMKVVLLSMIFVLTLAAVPGFADAAAFDYTGAAVNFIKEDGSGFGMLAPQEGTTCTVEGDNVVIHLVPKNTTTYGGFTFGTNEAFDAGEIKSIDYQIKDGALDLTLPKSYCGKATPVVVIKSDMTRAGVANPPRVPEDTQYYLAIPAAQGGTTEPTEPVDPQPGEGEEVNNQLNSGEAVEIKAGTYEAVNSEAITEGNKMFRCIKASLTVKEDGSAVLDMYLSGQGYDALYNGEKLVHMPNGAIGKDNPNNLWTSKDVPLTEAVVHQDGTVDGETKYHFELPFDKLYTWILVGGHSQSYDQWSLKTLNFSADNFKLVEEPTPSTPESPKTGDQDMVMYVVLFVLSLSTLIYYYREHKYYE